MKKRYTALLAAVTAVLMLGGCGAEDSSSSKPEKDNTSSAAETTSAQTVSPETSAPEQTQVPQSSATEDGSEAESKAGPGTEPAPESAFESYNDYLGWADSVGYDSGYLTRAGVDGINEDQYITLPDSPGYTSGKIVIGDSRCCQMGILQQRSGAGSYATFGVWGGHYSSVKTPPIVTDELKNAVRECFEAQIKAEGRCDIYFFATVNDYDFQENDNAGFIVDTVSAAAEFADMTFDCNGETYRPTVTVIGFDGCWTTSDLWGTPQEDFNRWVGDYSEKLEAAVRAEDRLSGCGFTTVPEICGGKAGFIDDGLHYSDETLTAIEEYVLSSTI